MNPTSNNTPAKNWYPNLTSLKLPTPLTHAMSQNFTLTYSLRDSVSSLQQTQAKTIQYGTHLNRTQTAAASAPDGALWFETDRSSIFYQARLVASTPQWLYAGGTMIANTPPTDLGINDTGFMFQYIGSGLYQWSGTGWVAI